MSLINLNEEQVKKLEKWQNENKNVENLSPIADRYTFVITPTSIGTVIIVKDNITGQSLDLTEDF